MVASSSTSAPTQDQNRSAQPVILVPGYHLFSAVAPLAAGTATKEFASAAALAIEEDSPFGPEQLAQGFFALPQGGGLVVFAALRRKFADAQAEWGKADFVVPDFATWLPRCEPLTGVVLLETTAAVTGLLFAGSSAVPRRIVSRPVLARDGDVEHGIAQARELVVERLDALGLRTFRYRLGEEPCALKGGRYRFDWRAQGFGAAKAPEAVGLSAAQLWAMDLREPEYLRSKRRDFQWNRRAWGVLLALGVAGSVLGLGELSLLGLRFANARRQARVEAQAPAARQSETNYDIMGRLAGYIDRKPQPLELLAYVNDVRPRSIYFTKVSIEGGHQMVIEGATSSLAEVNEFEAALRRLPVLAAVEVKNTRAREGGGTFQVALVFRAGFQLPATASVRSTPGAPSPAGPQSAAGAEVQPSMIPTGRPAPTAGGPMPAPLPLDGSAGPIPLPPQP